LDARKGFRPGHGTTPGYTPAMLEKLHQFLTAFDYEGAENVCPYELMFGYAPCSALQARLRVEQEDPDFDDIETDEPTDLTTSARTKALRFDRLHQRFVSIWQDRRERAYESVLNKSCKRSNERAVQVGDKVLALGRREHKWSRRFRGPFKIIRIIGKRLAVLLHEDTNVIEEHHIKNLKLYHEDEDDSGDDGPVDDDKIIQELVGDDLDDNDDNNITPDHGEEDSDDDNRDSSPQLNPKPKRAAKERALQRIRMMADDDINSP
ncbi:hypothetical protein FOZ60_001787, partial [Perkinsus olseni]